MTAYQSTWRRPIAQRFRQTAHASVRWCVRMGIHPNLVSYSSIVAAAGAGLCFWQAGAVPALLIVAVGFCYLRLWLNMLDGMVALASGKASRTGEIANELPDRISDVLIFVGVAHSNLCYPLSGYWVAILRASGGLCRHAWPGGRRTARVQRMDGKAVAHGRASRRRMDHAWVVLVGRQHDSLRRLDDPRLDFVDNRCWLCADHMYTISQDY